MFQVTLLHTLLATYITTFLVCTMAEDEIATKAPETDAQGSLVSGDTPAQEGASMGVRPKIALRLRAFTDLAS